MTTKFKYIVFVGLAALMIMSCKDDPTSIGEPLIPEEDKISIFAINSLDDNFNENGRTLKKDEELSFSNRILLGMHEETKHTSLIKFSISLADSIRSAVDSGKLVITKSWMELPVRYRLGAETAPYNFSIHEITSSWSAIGFTADSLAMLEYNNENLASNIVEHADSLITLDFDNDLIMDWIDDIMDGELVNIPGIILVPDMSSSRVLGFNAISTSVPETGIPVIRSIVEVPGEFTDTLLARPFSDVYVPEGPDIDQRDERLYLQGANVYRSHIAFNLDDLPENITINNAVLKLYFNESESFLGTAGTDSLLVFSVRDSTTMALDTLSQTRIRRTENYYEGALTAITQVALAREENHGVSIRLEQELSTANKIALYGTDAADEALRPLLTIIYTKKN